MEKLALAEQEFLTSQQAGSNVTEVAEAHRLLLEQLRADAARLQAAGADARTDAAALEAALKGASRSLGEEARHLRSRASRRWKSVSRAWKRRKPLRSGAWLRSIELEELLRSEFEQQEKKLADDRKEIDVLRAKLRVQIRKLEEGLDEAEEDAIPV